MMRLFSIIAVFFAAFGVARPAAQADYVVRIRPGQTLHSVAEASGVSLPDLISRNPHLRDPSRLSVGTRVRVPGRPRTRSARRLAAQVPTRATPARLGRISRETPVNLEHEVPVCDDEPLLFQDVVGSAFARAVRRLAVRLHTNPNYLMAIMHLETGGTFRPWIRNPSTRAVGLIQFLPRTARALGTSASRLARLTPVQQLRWVERYLEPFVGRMDSFEETYLAVFLPAAVGHEDDEVLFDDEDRVYHRNRRIDLDDDGRIQRIEVLSLLREHVERRLPEREEMCDPWHEAETSSQALVLEHMTSDYLNATSP